jgi:hypothetical protein
MGSLSHLYLQVINLFDIYFLILSVDTKPKALEGILEPNKFLENPEKYLLGKVEGAETLIAKNGAIYATLGNGDVVKIVGDKVNVLGRFGSSFSEFHI